MIKIGYSAQFELLGAVGGNRERNLHDGPLAARGRHDDFLKNQIVSTVGLGSFLLCGERRRDQQGKQ